MSYYERYNENQIKKHDKFCKKCPILEFAREYNNGWNFDECRLLRCYKLSETQYMRNKAKYGKFFVKDSLKSILVKDLEKVKELYKEGITQKEIGEMYGVGLDVVSTMLSKLKLKRFTIWGRNREEHACHSGQI